MAARAAKVLNVNCVLSLADVRLFHSLLPCHVLTSASQDHHCRLQGTAMWTLP